MLNRILTQEIRSKLYRYIAVSIFNVIVTLFSLWLLILYLAPAVANIIAVSFAAIPAFLLYRNWVWVQSGKTNIRKEILIFWLMSLAGLGFSTFTVWITTLWWEGFWIKALANITGFGIVWLGKFIFLEIYLFKNASKYSPRNNSGK